MNKHYQTLGLKPGASSDDIKKAYRRLAMKYHPDRNPDDNAAETKFKEVKEAYEQLTNPTKSYNSGPSSNDNFADGFSDIFKEAFRHGFGTRGNPFHKQWNNYQANNVHTVDITLEEAFSGKRVYLQSETTTQCSSCNGTGAEDINDIVTCVSCNGNGVTMFTSGGFHVQQICNSCAGSGKVPRQVCNTCLGSGTRTDSHEIVVDIPPGISTQDQIRATDHDYVFVNIRPHPEFERHGHNLHVIKHIDIIKATLGGEVELTNIDGTRIKIRIPKGTQPGNTLRMRGKGMPSITDAKQRGDLLCQVAIDIPKNLTAYQEGLLNQFKETLNE